METNEKLKQTITTEDISYSLASFSLGEHMIGKGCFSVVYKGKLLHNRQTVALKKVHLLEMVNDNAKYDCMKEINLLKRVNHPNIVRYICSFVEDKELYIGLEFTDGGDLANTIRKYRNQCRLIHEHTIWKYFAQISSGLDHMHTQSIMHRDIKPANVLMTSNGVVKLGDLGLGRYFSCNTKAVNTIVGTPYYMSPERMQEKPYSFSSDIWSLGCLLYEMATLQSPFHCKTSNLYVLCKKIENSDYCPIPSNSYSSKLRGLVSTCLTVNPDARPSIGAVNKVSKKMSQLRFKRKGYICSHNMSVLSPIHENVQATSK